MQRAEIRKKVHFLSWEAAALSTSKIKNQWGFFKKKSKYSISY